MPARLAIFVAQLGRKFRLFSLTMQRCEKFRCKTIVAGNYFRFISNVKMTNEARAEPNLFELCLARRNSTKSNDEWSKQVRMGHWDNGTKGHCVLIIHSGQILSIKIIIYIINIYINNIYNNSKKTICRPTTLTPDNVSYTKIGWHI